MTRAYLRAERAEAERDRLRDHAADLTAKLVAIGEACGARDRETTLDAVKRLRRIEDAAEDLYGAAFDAWPDRPCVDLMGRALRGDP